MGHGDARRTLALPARPSDGLVRAGGAAMEAAAVEWRLECRAGERVATGEVSDREVDVRVDQS